MWKNEQWPTASKLWIQDWNPGDLLLGSVILNMLNMKDMGLCGDL